MPIWRQRIIAVFTAAAVLYMGVDCVCAGGMSAASAAGARVEMNAAQMPCCAHHAGPMRHCSHDRNGENKSRPNPCGDSCQHCGHTVMNDTVAAPSHALTPLPSFFSVLTVELATGAFWVDLSPRSSAPMPTDLPPPLASPTLLSLHCALTN